MNDLIPTVRRLYDKILPEWEAFTDSTPSLAVTIRSITAEAPRPIALAIYETALELQNQEPHLCELRPIPTEVDKLESYRELLVAKENFLLRQTEMHARFRRTLLKVFRPLTNVTSFDAASPFSIPLIEAVPEPRLAVQAIYDAFLDGYPLHLEQTTNPINVSLFRQLTFDLMARLDVIARQTGKPILPRDSALTGEALVTAYLADTPFADLLLTPVPISFDLSYRMAHHLIIGGAGAGKTSMIERLLLHDLQDPSRPSVVLIDPTSDFIQRILSADLGLDDRLIYVNPRDIERPPAINVFAPNTRMARYDAVTREQVLSGVTDTFEYLFSGLFDQALTGRQAGFFQFVAALMLAFPETMGRNATIRDVVDLMDDSQSDRFRPAERVLSPMQQEFFKVDFKKGYRDTRQQIRQRLLSIVGKPSLERLFTQSETRIDLFAELNRGSVIVIDTADDFLGEASSVYGRLWISLVLQAILERAAIPEDQRRPTFIYIDEAMRLFDDKLGELLRKVRKYACGAVLASQELPGHSAIRSALMANTAIKMTCRPSAADAAALAPEMRTTRDYLLEQPKLRFATYHPGLSEAVSIPIGYGTFANLRRRDVAVFLERNRGRVSLGYPTPPAATFAQAAEPSPQRPDEDRSREW